MPQLVYFFAERVDILEAAVDGGEADIGDFVELVQFVHHEFTDQPRRHFALAQRAQLVADVIHGGIDGFDRHGSFFERLHHARAQLRFVERLARRIALDDAGHDQLG